MNISNQIKTTPLLVSFTICPFVQRSAILFNLKQQPFERIDIDLSNKPQWFLDRVPTGKVPALMVKPDDQSDEVVIFESAIINEYIDEQYGPTLLPSDSLTKAKQRAWVVYADQLLTMQYQLFNADDQDRFHSLMDDFFEALCKMIPANGEPYFDGVTFGLVDAAVAPVFTRLKWLPEIEDRLREKSTHDKKAARLLNWIQQLRHHSAVLDSVAENFDSFFVDYFKRKNSFALAEY